MKKNNNNKSNINDKKVNAAALDVASNSLIRQKAGLFADNLCAMTQ